MGDEFYNDEWYDARWKSMPLELRQRAVAILDGAISPETAELIKAKHAEHGRDWIHYLYDQSQETIDEMNAMLPAEYQDDLETYGWPTTMSAHHGFGTEVRNLLRAGRIGPCRNDTDGDADCPVCANDRGEWPPLCSEVLVEGISDDELPEAPYQDWKYEGVGPRNWDDYYCAAIEAALGLRDV